jgi:16S rRNA (guanine966-N2)-methyltransferase
MSEKARGALFNILGDISGLTLLDAFAGSGAISYEAASRGAVNVKAVEIDVSAYRTIRDNISALGLEDIVEAVRANVGGWSSRHPEELFDIVVCDPPYDGLQGAPVEKLAAHVRPGGTYVLSWPPVQPLPRMPLSHVSTKPYGDAVLIFYKNLL